MNLRLHRISIAVAAALLAFASAAQAPYKPGRTPDGEPDLRGIWEIRGTMNWNLEGHPGQPRVPASQSVIVDPPDGKIPYRPQALEKRRAMDPVDDPQAKCYMAGVPRITYTPGPFQIFQPAGMVVIVYQDLHTYRVIPTTPGSQQPDLEFWMGFSTAHWEGDTLVVDAKSFTDQTWLDKAGNFHSEDLRVVERYTLTGPNTMQYEARIEDPQVFRRPWTMRMNLERHTEPGFRILEDNCLEGEDGNLYHTRVVSPRA